MLADPIKADLEAISCVETARAFIEHVKREELAVDVGTIATLLIKERARARADGRRMALGEVLAHVVERQADHG
jgi:hypothetical protein